MGICWAFQAAYRVAFFTELDVNGIDWNLGIVRQKSSPVTYRLARDGEVIDTYTIISTGYLSRVFGRHLEKTATAKAGQVIIKNPDGEEYLYRNGVEESEFFENYESDSQGGYVSKAPPRLMVRIDYNCQFINPAAPMQGRYYVQAGGYVVFNGYDENSQPDIYGLQAREAKSTYGPALEITPALIESMTIPKELDVTEMAHKNQSNGSILAATP